MSDSLRVLLVTPDYPPPPGGIQTVVRNLETGLREQGHEVSVLHLPASGDALSMVDYIPRVSRLYGWQSVLKRDYPYLNLVYRKTRQRVESFEPDVVHSLHINNWTALRVAREFGIARILSAHALELQNTALARRAIKDADVVHVPSQFTEDLVHDLRADAETNIIPPAIDVQNYRDAAERLNGDSGSGPVVCIGRFVDRKNISTVIRAWEQVSERTKGGRELLIIGDGPNRDEIESLAAGEDDIQILGWVSEETKRELLAEASVFVLVPGREGYDVEGFGIVYIEAQAANTPVIGSSRGGVPEAIGGAGLAVEDETDPSAVAQSLERIFVETSTRSTKIENAEQRCTRFDISTVTERHVAMYCQAISD